MTFRWPGSASCVIIAVREGSPLCADSPARATRTQRTTSWQKEIIPRNPRHAMPSYSSPLSYLPLWPCGFGQYVIETFFPDVTLIDLGALYAMGLFSGLATWILRVGRGGRKAAASGGRAHRGIPLCRQRRSGVPIVRAMSGSGRADDVTMSISVSSWATTYENVQRSLDVILRIARGEARAGD